MIAGISDTREQQAVAKVIDGLATDPEAQGKPLVGSLAGYRSICAAGQRYRIVFKPERDKVVVYVVAAGLRRESDPRDIYELARKLVRVFKKKK